MMTASRSVLLASLYGYALVLYSLTGGVAAFSASASRCVVDGRRTALRVSTEQSHESQSPSPPAADGGGDLNPLLALIAPSKTVEIFSLVKQLEAEGQEVTSLCVGEPDYAPPEPVLDAVAAALRDGRTRYTAVTGTLELRKAIAEDLRRRKGVSYDPVSEIVIANGAKQAVFQGILAVAGAGDEVLVPAPHWPYPEMVKLTGAQPVIITTQPETGYLMTPAELRAALAAHPRAKLLILCNPSNPTGGVYDRKHLQQLVDVLREFPHVRVLSDEIYERLVYTEADESMDDACPSLASFPGMWERTLTINGFSKSHAMTGFRLGYLAAPAAVAREVGKIQSQFTSCASSLAQAGGVAALAAVPEAWLAQNVAVMRRKRDYVLARLAGMPRVSVAVPPRGAFYVLPDLSAYGDDAALCVDLLRTRQLALVPGSSFGAPGTVRISYATSEAELTVAMDKLEGYLQEKLPQL